MPLNTYDSILRVHVKAAYNLQKADLIGKSDPYIEIHIHEDHAAPHIQRTHVIDGDLNPVWNQDLFFLVQPSFENFKVVVKDKDTMSDASLGHVHVLRKDRDVRYNLTGDRYYLDNGDGGTVEIWTQEIPLQSGLINLVKSKLDAISSFVKQKNRENQYLLVTLIHGAKNLPSGIIDKADPYAKIEFQHDHVHPKSLKTLVIDNNPNPVWEAELSFLIPSDVGTFAITVFDENVGKDSELGMCSIAFKVGELKAKQRLALGKKGEIELTYIVTPLAPLFAPGIEEMKFPEPAKPPTVEVPAEPPTVEVPAEPPVLETLLNAPPPAYEFPVEVESSLPVVLADPDPISILEFYNPVPMEEKHEYTQPSFRGKLVQIRAKHSGRLLDVEGVSTQNDAAVHQWENWGGNNQIWRAEYNEEDNTYSLISLNSGKALDARSCAFGDWTCQWEYKPKPDRGNQSFCFHWNDNDGTFCIQSKVSGCYLDIQGGGLDNGAKCILWEYHGGDNQRFYIDILPEQAPYLNGKLVVMRAKHSGKYLDVEGVSTANEAAVHQWDYWGGKNQIWKADYHYEDDTYSFISLNSGKAIDGRSCNQGDSICQFTYNRSQPNQRFKLVWNSLDSTFFIQSVSTSCYLDISGSGTHNGAKCILWGPHGGDNQRFYISEIEKQPPIVDGKTVVIRSKHSGKVLDVSNVSTENDALIHQWDWWNGKNQIWKVEYHQEDGTFSFISLNSGKAMDARSCVLGEWLCQSTYTSTQENQKFHLHWNPDDLTFCIQVKQDGHYLDVEGGTGDNGGRCILWELHGGDNQRFYVETITP